MSKPGTIYRMQWDTVPVDTAHVSVPSQTVTVNIYDTENLIDDGDDEAIIELQAAMSPLTLSVINNEEDKFSPIKAKQAVIRFLTNTAQGQDMATFADSSDNRWKTEVLVDADTVFLGFLMLSDIQQPFLPDPQVVELTASDHLGILKDIPLVTLDDERPIGKYRIAELVAMCLRKTGLSLNINVINNIRHGTGTSTIPMAFVASGDDIVVSNANAHLFYPGQEITISGSASNNGTFKIEGIGTGIVTFLSVTTPLVDEAEVTVTVVDTSTGHFYDKIYLDALTYESNIGEMQDCYEVLRKILGEDCFLTQWRGEWWIFRIDEIDENPFYQFIFDSEGVLQSDTTINLGREIGYNKTVVHADASTLLRSERPHKFAKLVYRYINPIELVCNTDFNRGDFIEDMPDETVEGQTYSVKKYEIDCWEFAIHKSKGVASVAPVGEAYIKRLFYNDSEIQRYIEITGVPAPGTENIASIKSAPIPVQKQDKIELGADSRWDQNFDDGTATQTFAAELVADNGTYWYMHQSGHWFQYLPGNNYITFISNPAIPDNDYTQWQSNRYESQPIPHSGTLYLYLSRAPYAPSTKINHTNFSFTLIAFINGSYQKYEGHYNKVTRATGAESYNAVREKEVFIGDAPRKTFKGAMFFLDSDGVYNLTSSFYSANVFALGPPSVGSTHPYGYLQVFSVWNQYRNACRILPSSLLGLFTESTTDWPDILHKYSLTDTNGSTNNRYFMLVSFEQDWKTCQWKGTLIETYRRDIGHLYSDDFEFVYLTE